jgi:hypothetical protein
MPRKPERPCRYPGCPNLCEGGEQYCDEHKALMERHYEKFTRGYSPANGTAGRGSASARATSTSIPSARSA